MVALALFTIGAGQAKASLITNGSFEMGTDPGGSFSTPSGGDTTTITGWTVGGNSVDYIGGYWMASDGTRSLDMSGGNAGSISQAFTTVMGTTYEVLFDLAGNFDLQGVKTLNVSVGGPGQNYTFDSTGHSSSSMGWETRSFVFTATGTSTTLTFTSLEANPFGPALDNVRANAVPEPATLTMLGFGIAGLAGYGLRRRKQQVVAA